MERHQNPQSRRINWTVLGCALVVLLIAGAESLRWASRTRSASTPSIPQAVSPGRVALTELSRSHIPMPAGVPSAHASALATLPGDRMLAFWWAGSRESGPDVKVYASRWRNGGWSAPWEVASRASLGKALGFGVRRIGNPVAWTDRDSRIHLYVVATGLGGWAASRVAHMVSTDHGASFQVRRMLPMSPLFNTSVLVRTNPVGMADGGWWLPLYFEIGIKYPMLMAFDAAGDPTWLGRIGERTTTLQPAIVPVSATEVRAWMRDASDEQRVQQATSRDGGSSWEDQPALDLPNHGTSLAVIRLTSGQYLMLHNHVEAGGSSRSTLRLSISNDSHAWRTVADVARGPAGDEFSYPTMQQVGDELHVTYTHQRQSIAHHRYRIAPGESI
ncbi:exo-alpha-sialidase [Massilia sp. ST3]|uniref:sialidase family protein n=1 Tax=Massilia sp. ST3 TaxID=2824903 RepID=UPI001B80E85F|nr:sialidase family protein [Massilia sp. ST3]MBQ5947718.1 exo-alpha-sialidase [Massilia sp. ST3]